MVKKMKSKVRKHKAGKNFPKKAPSKVTRRKPTHRKPLILPKKIKEHKEHISPSDYIKLTFRTVGRLFPQQFRDRVKSMLILSGEGDVIPEEWLGTALIMSVIYALVAVTVILFLFKMPLILQLFVGVLVFIIAFFSYLLTLQYTLKETARREEYLFLDSQFFIRLFHSMSRFYPWNFREHIRKLILYSGDRWTTPEHWLGVSSLVSLLYGIIAGILVFGFFSYPIYVPVLTFFITFFMGLMVQYLLLYYSTERRRKTVERILPDFLQLIAADIRAGMTPFAALRASARREFGPLEYEVQYATAKSLGTESFSDALKEISRTINSKILERVIKLFTTGLKSGGQLSSLLENAAHDITQTQELNKQLITSTKMYSLFILFNITVGTPLMLSISLQFVDMVSGFQGLSGEDQSLEELGGVVGVEEIPLTSDFLLQASVAIVVITCLLASAFMGVINEGRIKNGFRYFIPLSIVSLVMFFIFRILVSQIIGSMI